MSHPSSPAKPASSSSSSTATTTTASLQSSSSATLNAVTGSPFSPASSRARGTLPPIDPSHHPLETPWSFWVDRKGLDAPGASEQQVISLQEDQTTYLGHLQCLGTCQTVENFWSFYTHLVRPYDLPRMTNFHFFRNQVPPAWESYPSGGSWIVKIRKESGMLARLWEKLLFSVVGESLEEPDIVGVVLSIRPKEDVISVWNADTNNRFRIADKVKRLLRIGPNTVMEYKTNLAALQDHSSYRNANKFIVQANEGMSPPPTPPLTLVPLERKLRILEEQAKQLDLGSSSSAPAIAQPRPRPNKRAESLDEPVVVIAE